MATWGDCKKILNLHNYDVVTDLRMNFSADGVHLEKLFPGCSVYWDVWPAWHSYYLKLECPIAWGRTIQRSDEMRLVAYECHNNTLILKRIPETVHRGMYEGDPVKAYYTGVLDHWKPLERLVGVKTDKIIIDDPYENQRCNICGSIECYTHYQGQACVTIND